MKKLYVIEKIKDLNSISYRVIPVEEETDLEYSFIEKINDNNTFPKSYIDKEFEFLFVSDNKRKLKKQMERIYKNIEKVSEEEISRLNHKLNQLKEEQKTNKYNLETGLEFIKKG